MKKINITLYVIFTIFLLTVSCNNQELPIQAEKTFTLDLNLDNMASIFETGLIKDVEIISLDCDEVVFHDIARIVRHRNRIYLMDIKHNHAVFVYDSLGHFINSVNHFGQGAEEYIQLTDIFISHDDNSLNLVSRADKKILQYDADGKELLKVLRTPKAFTHLLPVKDGYIGDMANYREANKNTDNLWFLSDDLKMKKSFMKIADTWGSVSFEDGVYPVSVFHDSIFYFTQMDYNIYMIYDGKISVPYSFDLGEHTCPPDLRTLQKYDELKSNDFARFLRYTYHFDYFHETENHVTVIFRSQGQKIFGIYNKQSGKLCTVTNNDDYIGKYVFSFGRIIGIDEHAIYTLVDSENIKQFWDGKNAYIDFEAKYPEQIKNLRKRFPSVREDGNPFLVIYTIN
jgi:hypothetical protein